MNAQQFFNLVAQMRDAQNKYFRTRSAQALNEARNLERRIDAEIKRVQSIIAPAPKEQELFSNEDE